MKTSTVCVCELMLSLFLVITVMYMFILLPSITNRKIKIIDLANISQNNKGIFPSKGTVKVYRYEDTKVTRFDVGSVNLQFHPAFKNPCFVEYINESVMSVYEDDRFLTEDYFKKSRLGNRLSLSFQTSQQQYGVLINSSDLCGPVGVCRLRCLPYYMLIGAAKCGTSDFAKKATSHPQIFGAVNKELFYWSQFRFIINATVGDYSTLFDPSVPKILEEKITRRNGKEYYPRILSEYTSQTLGDDPFWRLSPRNAGQKEPLHLKIHDLYSVNPNLKIVVILRKPSNKLYSSYNMYRRTMMHSPQDFHKRVLLSLDWWKNCTQKLGLPIRTCAYSCVPEMPPVLCRFTLGTLNQRWSSQAANYSTEILRAMYSIFVKDWLNVFPREQVLFLRTEDSYNMTEVMNDKVLPFVGMDSVSIEETPKMYNSKHNNARDYKPMLSKTKKLLDEFYAPFNRDLADMLGDNKWLWTDVQ